MEKSFLLRRVLWLVMLSALLFPAAHLLFYIPMTFPSWDPFLVKVMAGATSQTLLSLLFTFLLGVPATFGLIALKVRLPQGLFQIASALILVPGFIPPLLLVLLGSRAMGYFPTGLAGVVVFHVMMNLGLFSFVLYQLIYQKSSIWIDQARIGNLPPLRFVTCYLLPELRGDLSLMGLFYFVLYFFSFSVPFLVGGSLYGGVEVYIYEKVLFFGQWGEALHYSLILFLFLFALSYWLRVRYKAIPQTTGRLEPCLKYFSCLSISWLPLLPTFLLFYGLLLSSFILWSHQGVSFWNEQVRGTMLVGLGTGLFILCFLILTSFAFLKGVWSRILLSFTHPGWVVVGFSMLLLPGEGTLFSLLKLSLSLGLLYFPFIYRLGLEQSLIDLHHQVEVAESFPVSWTKTYFQILFPQLLPTMAVMSGLGALWACGDFALTGILLDPSRTNTLAYEMKNLVTSYRLDQALLLVGPLLLYSLLVFAIFQGFAYVGRKKIQS